MASESPPTKKRLLDTGQSDRSEGCDSDIQIDSLLDPLGRIHLQLESCYSSKCLCNISEEDIQTYIQLNQTNLPNPSNFTRPPPNSPEHDTCLLYLNFITWAGEAFHDQLISGRVCQGVHNTVRLLLDHEYYLDSLLAILQTPEDSTTTCASSSSSSSQISPPSSSSSFSSSLLKFSAARSLVSLLPLAHCGREEDGVEEEPAAQVLLRKLVDSAFGGNTRQSQEVRDKPEESLLDSLEVGEEAGLGDLEMEAGETRLSDLVVEDRGQHQGLVYKAWIVTVLAGCVSHGGRQREDCPDTGVVEECPCIPAPLGEECLCQEVAVRCSVVRAMDTVWTSFTDSLLSCLSCTPVSSTSEVFLVEGFRLWQSLLSSRANLSFMTSRPFSSPLPSCLPRLSSSLPSTVWRAVLDTVSEELCYGTTLGLQSVPPEEPCQLAHCIIRLVRFSSFLPRIPHSSSPGFGGSCSTTPTSGPSPWDKGLVQKMVLIVLKCVALTTREARVESSSGESDSSLSSRESVGSGGSDMVIIERTMAGMYKVLDSWIKQIIPLSPHHSLQESLLHILQDQDDVLVEGLLCLLDTHMALYPVGSTREPEQGLLDTNPTRGFLTLLGLVARDSSVLLDFLVSNETCFLLYLLRLLKFLIRDWAGFMEAAEDSYSEAVQILLDLKASIARLVNKSLFPYNIGPVYRLLERVEAQHSTVIQYS